MRVRCGNRQTEAQPSKTYDRSGEQRPVSKSLRDFSFVYSLRARTAVENKRGRARIAGFALAAAFASVVVLTTSTHAGDLVVASSRGPQAIIVLSPSAGPWERRAATDLQKYIRLMSGAELSISAVPPEAAVPALYVGQVALATDPTIRTALNRVAKPSAAIRSDAIAVRRNENRVLLAGSNDELHYFAVVWLLNQWGCRWYVPTEFGEVVPDKSTLSLGELDFAYAPPFEIRHYWLSWNADGTGSDEFRRRNFMTETSLVGNGHALARYTSDIAPPGKSAFAVPFSDSRTAMHVASKIEPDYAAGKDVGLAIEDGIYASDSPSDHALQREYDRYVLKPSLTDAMMTLYQKVSRILRAKHPESRAKIGGMAYSNVTLPPKLVTDVEPNIFMWLAPIDIDPNHGMDDPRSPPRQEYKEIMYEWARQLRGRLAIYDYDQGMLVWRDLPNPSHQAFASDVKHYARAGILGVGTESRGATATTFLNLFLRGQLMWNPNADVATMLEEFFPAFYGPAAKAAAVYWNTIFDAWRDTIVTEHEFMAALAIYTPELVLRLERALLRAETAVRPLVGKPNRSRNEDLYLQRVRFTRLGFDLLRNYVGMVAAAASDNAYAKAEALGEQALVAREALTDINPTFTTYRKIGEPGPAWLPGEVAQMRDLASMTNGPRGKLVAQLPLEWWFRRSAPVAADWTYTGPEDESPKDAEFAAQEAATVNGWRRVRADRYLQGQGIINENGQSALGHFWYKAEMNLTPSQVSPNMHIMFPGLFNETWLYLNGDLVAHRNYQEPWWLNDYKFEWDVEVAGHLRLGLNIIALRGFNPHHFGGMFRRPFIYAKQ